MLFRYLIILFIGIPLAELMLLLKIGEIWGAETTIGLVLLTGFTGAYLAKTQGAAAWQKIHTELLSGRMPGDKLLDGLMIFAGGITLLTPGFITDFTGLCLLLPPTRAIIMKWLKLWFKKKLADGAVQFHFRQ